MKENLVEAGLPWAAKYDPEVPLNLVYPEVPLFELVEESIKAKPEGAALVFMGKTISYAELGRYIDSMVVSLKEIGLGQGDRIALLLPNSPQYVISYVAILKAGATVVPVNPLSTEMELLHIIKDGGVRGAISLDLLAARVENVKDRCRESGDNNLLEFTFYTSLREFMPFPLNVLYPLKQKTPPEVKERLAGCRKFSDLLTKRPGKVQPPQLDLFKGVAVIIYTGGTTGKPKGVMLSHYGIVCNALQSKAWANMTSDDSLLTVLPTFHGFGMSVCMNAPLISGAKIILMPRYSVTELLKTIHKYRPSLFAGVPTMFVGIINNAELAKFDLTSLRGCFVGAAALAPEIKTQFEKLTGARLMEGYGLTEAVTAICCNPYNGENKTGSVGMPFPDVIMTIRDIETGEIDLPPLKVGELVLKCPDLMLGYYNRTEETNQALRKGWLFTGDLGYMDEDGYFYIVDRKKDMIISGGFNVYPREVEDLLYQHPAVKEASVIGIPDKYRGELVKAFVSLKDNQTSSEEEIIAFCREHLIHYKVPSVVEICDELPKTAIGKILKRALREQEAQSQGKQPEAAAGGNAQ